MASVRDVVNDWYNEMPEKARLAMSTGFREKLIHALESRDGLDVLQDREAEHFKETWPAFQREDVDLWALSTDIVRLGYPKPTIYREHHTIHALLNLIDQLRRQL